MGPDRRAVVYVWDGRRTCNGEMPRSDASTEPIVMVKYFSRVLSMSGGKCLLCILN
jgi:hypothetical protein